MSCLSSRMRTLARAACWVAIFGLAAAVAEAGETTNKIGVTLLDIPAGSFMMGSCKVSGSTKEENKKRAFLGLPPLAANCANNDAGAGDNESPQHRVSVWAFQIGKTEVTLGQFKKFIVAAERSDLVTDNFMKYNAYGDSAPVVQVSWHDAQAFIEWLNKTEGGGHRLPSEAEWEYACRAGGDYRYCGGDNAGAVAWYDDNSGKRPHPVAGKQANAFGLYDMSGNVWEWVQDCAHDSYRDAPNDGSAWTSSCGAEARGLRGGSWFYIARSARAAYRDFIAPANRSGFIGFRLVRSR